jgi:hypothetical protein
MADNKPFNPNFCHFTKITFKEEKMVLNYAFGRRGFLSSVEGKAGRSRFIPLSERVAERPGEAVM